MTAPVAQTNRVGCYIVAGGSASDDEGNVSTNLIGATQNWSNVLANTMVTTPITDGVRAFCIRCPRGTWANTAGGSTGWYNHCNANGTIVRANLCFHALLVAALRSSTRLTVGFGTFLAGLNAQGCATTVYNNGLPNSAHPGVGVLSNWAGDPLTQTGYPTLAEVTSLAYVQAMYQDELDNGVTEFAFDATGGDQSTYMLSNALFPLLTATGTQSYSGYTGTFTNAYARKVAVEANPPSATGSWLTPYSFTARHPTFWVRIGDSDYIQPSAVAYTPSCIFQGSTFADWEMALSLAPTYRVWVKWTAMKAAVGADRMAELLAAGADAVVPPSGSTGVTASGGIKFGNPRMLPGRWHVGMRG